MKKFFLYLTLVLLVLVSTSAVFAAETELPDYSKIDENLKLINNSVNASGFVNDPFTVVDGYVVSDGEQKGYNVVSSDGTLTIQNNFQSDKYIMYLTLIPLKPASDGTYYNQEEEEDFGYMPEYFFYRLYEGEPNYVPYDVYFTDPLMDSDVVKIRNGESLTFRLPTNVCGWDYSDVMWIIRIDTIHGEFKEDHGLEIFCPTVEDDYGWYTARIYKVDDEAVNRINLEAEKTNSKTSFADVAENDYFYLPVNWAIENGITKGTSDTTFSPNATCTHAQILTFLWRANGSGTSDINYDWIDNSTYYADALKWAYTNKIIDSSIDPNTPCNRIDTVKYLYLLSDTKEENTSYADNMTDVSEDDKNIVAWAIENGITYGTSDTTFSPSNTCTRGQIITFLYRAYYEAK